MQPFTDECAALLAEIAEHPDDQALRMIYADWLEERGEPLADFVRLQCARASAKFQEQFLLHIRCQRLLDAHLADWLRQLGIDRMPVSNQAWIFRGGVTEGLRLNDHEFVRFGDQCFGAVPTLRRLDLVFTGRGTNLRRVLDSPQLERIEELRVTYRFEGARPSQLVTALAESSRLHRLRRLSLDRVRLDIDSISALVAWPQVPRLEVLRLAGARIDRLGASMLAATAHWQQLRELRLDGNRLGDDGARAVFQSANMPALESLGLGSCELSNNAVTTLAETSTLPSLRRLRLPCNRISADGARALADFGSRPALEELVLQGNPIGNAGVRALAASPHLRPRDLDLSRCEIDSGGIDSIIESDWLSAVHRLAIGWNPIGDHGAVALARLPVSRLIYLAMNDCQLGDAAAMSIADSTALERLAHLILFRNRIGDRGASALAASRPLRQLESLRLGANRIGDSGADAIARSKNLAHVSHLDLHDNPIGYAGKLSLQSAPTWVLAKTGSALWTRRQRSA